MNKEFEMEIFLGIAIVLAAAGLFYLKFINTPKIEEPTEDPAIVELRKEVKAINDDINELMRVRDDQYAMIKSIDGALKSHAELFDGLKNNIQNRAKDIEQLAVNFKEVETKFKMVNTQVVRLQSSMLKGPANVNVKIDGAVLFEMKKPEVTPAPVNPPSKGKGVKKLLDQVGI